MVCRREGRSPDRRHTTRRRRDRPGGRIVQPGNEGRRGQPPESAMRPSLVVVHPPLVENDPSLWQAQEQFPVEQLLRVMITSRAVNDLATSIARRSLVNSSITTRIRRCLPSSVGSVRKSWLHTWFR